MEGRDKWVLKTVKVCVSGAKCVRKPTEDFIRGMLA